MHLDFFNAYLKRPSTTALDFPRARIFITGSNQWRDLAAYPPASAITKLYLSSDGGANSLRGNGRLLECASGDELPDRYAFDPRNPVPFDHSAPGGVFAVDRRPLEERHDVLVYTGAVLEGPLQVIGQVSVELHASSDAPDTDFTASLLDVYPDGRALVLGPRVVGIIRARYRNGLESTELLSPGEIACYRIDLGHIAHSFQPGHRIRLEISSSAAPTFNPNQNTGHPIATDTEWRTAHQNIYHDAARPSALLLPKVSHV
jgi:putative CocE/NonD family hydrolase